MKKLAILALCTALVSPACAETMAEKTGVNSTLGMAPTTADFVHEAAISDMFEIESRKLAEQRSDDATKQFAAKMISDHTKTTSELKPLAMKSDSPVPSELDSAHKDMLDKLAGLKGKDFTAMYHADQVTAHKQAVSLFDRTARAARTATSKSSPSQRYPTCKAT